MASELPRDDLTVHVLRGRAFLEACPRPQQLAYHLHVNAIKAVIGGTLFNRLLAQNSTVIYTPVRKRAIPVGIGLRAAQQPARLGFPSDGGEISTMVMGRPEPFGHDHVYYFDYGLKKDEFLPECIFWLVTKRLVALWPTSENIQFCATAGCYAQDCCNMAQK